MWLHKAEDLNGAHLSSKALVKQVLVSCGNWVPLRGFSLDREGGEYLGTMAINPNHEDLPWKLNIKLASSPTNQQTSTHWTVNISDLDSLHRRHPS